MRALRAFPKLRFEHGGLPTSPVVSCRAGEIVAAWDDDQCSRFSIPSFSWFSVCPDATDEQTIEDDPQGEGGAFSLSPEASLVVRSTTVIGAVVGKKVRVCSLLGAVPSAVSRGCLSFDGGIPLLRFPRAESLP